MTIAHTLVLLGTGGTIAGVADDPQQHLAYRSAQVPVSALVERLMLPAGCMLECMQVAQVDSKDMGPAVWRPLLQQVQQQVARPEVRGVVVTHGTDTLEETAYLLQAVLNPAKPVVLASAMRPSTALSADGPQNLQDALCLAAEPGARGVMAVCAGSIHGALEVQKEHPYRLDAFGSGEAGPLGRVMGGQVLWWRPTPNTPDGRQARWQDRLLSLEDWPRVEWLTSHAGGSGAMVRALLLPVQPPEQPVLGLLVATSGNGTLHQELEQALRQAKVAGVRVWRSTRCSMGAMYSACADDEFPSCGLIPSKARLALMLDLL